MIELTKEQHQAMTHAESPARVRDPATNETYVLLKAAEYERLQAEYDASPWTDEEMDLLAAESAALLDNFGKQP